MILRAAAVIAGILYATQSWAQTGPGSVFSVPEPGGEAYEAAEDQEVETDLPIFLKRGYQVPDWKVHEAYVLDAANDVIVPDYKERTGRDPGPIEGRVEIAAAMLTNPHARDMISISRLPGDCSEEGCLFQIWSVDGESWEKVFEVTALSLAYKDGPEGNTHFIAAIGDSVAPSKLFIWTGTEYMAE